MAGTLYVHPENDGGDPAPEHVLLVPVTSGPRPERPADQPQRDNSPAAHGERASRRRQG